MYTALRFLTLPTVLLTLALHATYSVSAATTGELIEARKIWDQAPHSAFTDLKRFKGEWFCVFREGQGHVSSEASIRVIHSRDGNKWQTATLLQKPGYDLRDAKLAFTPDGRLMLVGAATTREGTKPATSTQSFVSFSKDGLKWTPIEWAGTKDFWLWRVTWHEGWAYGVAYDVAPASRDGKRYGTQLWMAKDGASFVPLVQDLYRTSGPTEATLRFGKDDTVYCLQRRDGKESNTALLGSSKPPYVSWEWKDMGRHLGGPDFIQLPDGRWIAAGRLHGHGTPPATKTVVCELDVKQAKLLPLVTLPSGGDSSYPGLVWHDDLLWVSYYSSHESKTSIYLAKVKLSPAGKTAK